MIRFISEISLSVPGVKGNLGIPALKPTSFIASLSRETGFVRPLTDIGFVGKDDRAFSASSTTTTFHFQPLHARDVLRANPGHRYIGLNGKDIGIVTALHASRRKLEMLHRYLTLAVADSGVWDHWIILAKKSLSCKS